MKLLHLISEKPPVISGFSRVISKLTEELTNMGHEVHVLCARDCNIKLVGDIKLVTGTDNIHRYIRNGNYDVINIHGHTPTFSDRLLLDSKLYGNRVVYVLHCMVNCYFKPLFTLYNSVFNNVLLRLADAVVVSSESYYNLVQGCPRKYVVPWGVDVEKFSGNRATHNGYKLLFVGQMRPYKGLDVFLQAMNKLDAELNIVGDGPYKSRYEKYAQKLGLRNINFYGNVSDDQLRQMYLSSDVLVLPSVSLNEAFGLVTLEAASAGCAVVASDLPGLRDVVKEFGLLVKPNDPNELRDALLTLGDRAVREQYVTKGKEVVKEYSWQRVAENYTKIYSEAISGDYTPITY
ncbi:MAG: glycosyltransferase family 4 protein [Candidatus Bathyarchaeota archaeon]|nr:glycosyltransferase family 4 protein [Candidatus Bathyarchaeum sp.]